MATRRAIRLSIQQLLLAVLVAVVVWSSISSAAKCYFPKPKTSVAPTTTPAVDNGSSDTPTVTEAPTVVDAEADETPKAPTKTTETTATALSSVEQGGSFLSQASAEESFESSNDGQGSSFPNQASTGGSNGGVSQTASTSTSDHVTFGAITSKKGGCVVGNPNTFISLADLDDQWDRRMSTYVPTFENLIFDQIANSNASLIYWVRWDSTKKLSKSVAAKFASMIASQYKWWDHWLTGYDCWPYEKSDVKVVAFAARDDLLGKIYEGGLDADGIPKCPD
ncbi:hypothetical protein PC129_g10402 [Phytophthora cactorum]|uniref:Uncharacterized protein n=1 Tax=Phytophthora cactorum TaxID=29920 RepID=A0A8T1I2V8_9STRA|nr:hypothetical protein Pcac1_g18551 [Phytophthora cactorum]KAG2831255.1 hypothetical protein PC112_g7361 [Phytophthora cactorum]KAG2833851.1 hypothetical protein PC111_g6067 [Phytophthora cactorum]KAG2861181.1 hypothetical protein PC113_g7413 [Phytophthora cactorum]KAG2916576.1 hypothetical protein PC114_g7442 [Phytophthora cactorum]